MQLEIDLFTNPEVRITQSIALELLDLLQNSEIVIGQPVTTSGTRTVTCNVDHSSGGTCKYRLVLVYWTHVHV